MLPLPTLKHHPKSEIKYILSLGILYIYIYIYFCECTDINIHLMLSLTYEIALRRHGGDGWFDSRS